MSETRIHTEFEGGEFSQILNLFENHMEAFDGLYGRIPVHRAMHDSRHLIDGAYESEHAWNNLLGGGNSFHRPGSATRIQLVAKLREIQLGRPVDAFSMAAMAQKDARTIAALDEYLAHPEQHTQNHWTEGLEHDLDYERQGMPESIRYFWAASRLGELLESANSEHNVPNEVLAERCRQLEAGITMLQLEADSVSLLIKLFKDQWPDRVAILVANRNLGAEHDNDS